MNTDVAIIGGGPAGLIAARRLGERGFTTHVYEMSSEIGIPNHCAGLLSKEGLENIWGRSESDFIQNEVKGGKIFSPNGGCISFRDDKVRAYVIDRTLFDKCLAEKAESYGVSIHTEEMVKGLIRNSECYNGITLSWGEVNADIIIDAEGPGRLMLRRAGLHSGDGGLLGGMNMEVSGIDVEPEMVELWFSNKLAPGFFAWVIPLSESRARCGLACNGGQQLPNLRKFIFNRFEDPVTHGPRGGMVVTNGPISRTYYDGLIIVGDAAGQVKPTTGGGVVLGGLCASIAGDVASEALDKRDTSSNFLVKYERSWKDKLDRQFRYMLMLRGIMDCLDDDTLDALVSNAKSEGVDSYLQSYVEDGDMDLQADVIKRAMKNPRILSTGIGILGGLALKRLKGVVNL